MGTDARPDSENDCECLSTSSRSRDPSLSTDGIVSGPAGDVLVGLEARNVEGSGSRNST